MLDLYNIIINDPVYLTVAVLLAVAVVFSIVKKQKVQLMVFGKNQKT